MIHIQKAVASDAEILSDLGRSTFLETFAKDNSKEDMNQYLAETFVIEKQLQEIQDQNRRIEVAWNQSHAVGFFHLLEGIPDPSVTGPKPIEILRLYVDSRWHGKGVGAALMERALQISYQEAYQTIWLGVWERNFRAQAFYKKYGFTVVGEHVFRLGSDDQIDLIMCRAL